jgi:hypothetical protein
MTTEPKPQTCGDCERWESANGIRGQCQVDLPRWITRNEEIGLFMSVHRNDEMANDCNCFKRKAAAPETCGNCAHIFDENTCEINNWPQNMRIKPPWCQCYERKAAK